MGHFIWFYIYFIIKVIDSTSFNKELTNILTDLLIDKIKYMIRCSELEHMKVLFNNFGKLKLNFDQQFIYLVNKIESARRLNNINLISIIANKKLQNKSFIDENQGF